VGYVGICSKASGSTTRPAVQEARRDALRSFRTR
jgi:hypothetical protein